MTAKREGSDGRLSKAALRARVVGDVVARDDEEIRFWRNASQELRARTLYRLRARGKAMRAAVPHQIEEDEGRRRLVLTPGRVRIFVRDE